MSVQDMEADENRLEAGPPTFIHMGGVSSKISYFQEKCPALYTHSPRIEETFSTPYYFFVNTSRSEGRSARSKGKSNTIAKRRNCTISIGHVGKLFRICS